MDQPASSASAAALPLEHTEAHRPSMTVWEMISFFLRLGLVYGGGTGIAAALQREVVDRRKDFTRGEFMTIYGLARIVPSGSSTALTAAFGYQYRKLLGSVIALVALITPGFFITVFLTIGRELLVGTPAFAILDLTLMPAALAVVIVSTWNLAQEFFTPSVELVLAITGCIGVAVFGMNPPVLLILGGIVGAFVVRPKAPKAKAATAEKQP
jgi:chromate transporter